MSKYQVLEIIGDGTYGTVYRGVNIEKNEKVAIKKLKAKVKSWEECKDMNEVRTLRNLQHENIIKLIEVIHNINNEVSYIFEYADTNLYEYIDGFRKRNERIPEHRIKNIIYQIAAGLNFMHQRGYMHRDLKPENILIMENTNAVKIGDFGVAKEIPSYHNSPLTDYVCTRWYRAPECVLKSNVYNSSIDVWALGCIMAEMYGLKPIFAGQNEFDQLGKIAFVLGTPNFNDWPEGFKLIQKLGMKFPICNRTSLSHLLSGIGVEAMNLLNDIFNWDPEKRPTCANILQHRFFGELRPSTYSFPTRFEAQKDRLARANLYSSNSNSKSNSSDYDMDKFDIINSFNNNNYRPSQSPSQNNNNLINSLNPDINYLKNLNYQNYQINNGLIPDINSIFNKDSFIPAQLPFHSNKYNNTNSNNNNNNNNANLYSKNRFSFMAEKDILAKRRRFNGNSPSSAFQGYGYDNSSTGNYNSNNFYNGSYSNAGKSNFFNYPPLNRMNQYPNRVFI